MSDQNKEQNWGLVLSGGGAKGSYQIGVWKAMKELGIESWIGGISGASIGALNAALFACGDYKMAETAWTEVDLLSVFDTEWTLLDGKEGTFSREEMLTLIRRYVQFSKLMTRKEPVICSVSRLLSNDQYRSSIQGLMGETVYAGEYMHIDGRTAEMVESVLLASSALPFVYEPVEINGAYYRDGGLTDNVPIQPLYDLGYRKIILIGLKAEMKRMEAAYPDVEFLSIYPSYPLGDLFRGTLNFQPRHIKACEQLGYKDGIRTIHAWKTGDTDSLHMQELAKLDYEAVLADLHREELQDSIGDHMATLQGIIDRYSE